jgi:hypothetical protein
MTNEPGPSAGWWSAIDGDWSLIATDLRAECRGGGPTNHFGLFVVLAGLSRIEKKLTVLSRIVMSLVGLSLVGLSLVVLSLVEKKLTLIATKRGAASS